VSLAGSVAAGEGPIQHRRLTHPEFGFWVDVRLREFDGRWLAVADIDD
jgi:hypothetical protein